MTSLKSPPGYPETEFVLAGSRLGDVLLRFRSPGGDWQTADTAKLGQARTVASRDEGKDYQAVYVVTKAEAPTLRIGIRFLFREQDLLWNIFLENLGGEPLEIGDLAIPLPMNSRFRRGGSVKTSVLKHSFLSGHGSYIFWMRPDSAPPYLTLTPTGETKLEYWDTQGGIFQAYIHSAAAGALARERGTKWRQPNTSLSLAATGQSGSAQSYGFKLEWADSYDDVRNLLVKNGLIDVHVVPGMTVPSDLSACFALRTTQNITSIEAEFPATTRLDSAGTNGDFRLYRARFSRLGENRLTVSYGPSRHLYLEFFSTEPLETLIRKRAAFIARCQHRDPSKWYNGLISEWNMESQVLLGPDNYDRIRGWRIYAVSCDDPGLSKPAFLAAKNAEFPVQSEVEALDYYLQHFVWGGLQRTTGEEYPYGIYGIPDWKTNRESADPGRTGQLHLWRVYDYPHVVLMYFSLYRLARNHPGIKTVLTSQEYLQRAWGTALAMFTVPWEIEKWSAYHTGFYNELVIVDLLQELEAAGMKSEAAQLRNHWERKVRFFVNDQPDLFGSEYPFDSTGFESTHALAKYAVTHTADPGRAAALALAPNKARQFMESQMAANIFCRGWLEPAYYYLGSDYRASAGNAYTLSYMSPMGGWAVLDYGLHFSTHPPPYLRLGYASYLSSWALMNTGTPESNYGYWYPGQTNDGGAGGGFEPAPYGQTWLGQPHHRGPWYYACETDLGYCGALRTAATVLADDPIFGRFCFGGDSRPTPAGLEVTPKDGLRRRFHALINGHKLHLSLDNDRFSSSNPILLQADLSRIRFSLEGIASPRPARLRISGLPTGSYSLGPSTGPQARFQIKDAHETALDVKLDPLTPAGPYSILLER